MTTMQSEFEKWFVNKFGFKYDKQFHDMDVFHKAKKECWQAAWLASAKQERNKVINEVLELILSVDDNYPEYNLSILSKKIKALARK